MEPRGCNRWQRTANGTAAQTAEQAKTVAVGCDRLPSAAHGKEGVDDSSPSEGSKRPANQLFLLPVLNRGKEGISIGGENRHVCRAFATSASCDFVSLTAARSH